MRVNKQWKIEFFATSSGKSPVTDFIDRLQAGQKAKITRCMDLLQEYGPKIKAPHSKKLSGCENLFELRSSGSSPVRLIYSRTADKFLVLNAFVKKTNKTPVKEINTACRRLKLLLT